MVGRSKPKKMVEMMQYTPSEDFAAAEIKYLKSKNSELAKALSEAKVSIKQTMDERDYLQKKLFHANLRNSELVSYLSRIDHAARRSIQSLATMSTHIRDIAEISITSVRKSDMISPTTRHSIRSPESPNNKLHVVKPMIDGHVIHRPTISLRRVNENSLNQFLGLHSSSSQNINNTISNMPLDNNENADNNSYHLLSTDANLPSFGDQSDYASMDGVENEDSSEFDEEPSHTLERDHVNSHHLHTIEELTEELLDHSNEAGDGLSTTANASTSSVTVPGHSTKGPLLSGVFQDVRVYLSPMQDLSSYLKPLQTTTNERQLFTSKNLPKKQYSQRTVALDENNKCVVTIKSPSFNQSTENIDSAHSSLNDSSNSILTSTRISNNFEETCRDRNSDYVQKRRWPNKFESFPVPENMHMLNNSTETSFDKSTNWASVNENGLNGLNFSSSFHTPNTSSTVYDPLEGPSSLLDSRNNSIYDEKIQQLKMLGLQPKSSTESHTSNPTSPADAVLKRRVRDQQASMHSKTSPSKATPQKNKSIYITKRKLNIKKPVISSKKRKSLSPSKTLKKYIKSSLKRESISPLKRESTSPLQCKSPNSLTQISFKESPKKDSIENIRKRKKSSRSVQNKIRKSEKLKKDLYISMNSSISASRSSKKAKRSNKQKNSLDNSISKKSKSPEKSPAPRRKARCKIQSLKEPSLGRKMRRS